IRDRNVTGVQTCALPISAAEAVTALRNMFFPGSASAPEVVPWTTFTDPELAHVGMTAGEARKKLGRDNVRVFEWDLSHSDRAREIGRASCRERGAERRGR